MVRTRKIELMDGELLPWPVQVWSVIAVVIASFCIAVFLVTISFYIFDHYHGDGRDPFIKEIKYQQQFKVK